MAADGWGAAIGAALDIGGGLIGRHWQEKQLTSQRDREDLFREQDRAEREMVRAREEALQREFAQHGIRWRVEDAKAAGLHPLYALGGAGATFSPSPVQIGGGYGGSSVPEDSLGPALGRAGQNLSRAVMATETPDQRAERALRLQLLRSQVDESDARTWAIYSQAARDTQGARVSTPMPPAKAMDQYLPQHMDMIQSKPDEVVSQRSNDPSVTAGSHAGWRETVIGQYGLKIRLPYSEEGPSEALENVPWWMWPMIIQHNRSYYGGDWGTRFLREFMFNEPPRYREHGRLPYTDRQIEEAVGYEVPPRRR